ncbi:unnamed protein product [Bathycoccus prasinos]
MMMTNALPKRCLGCRCISSSLLNCNASFLQKRRHRLTINNVFPAPSSTTSRAAKAKAKAKAEKVFSTTTTTRRRRNVERRSVNNEDELLSFASQLEPPKVDLDLESLQEDLGAVVDENGFVLRYGEEIEEEVKILRNECAIIDRSEWGIFRVASGAEGDMVRFLETLSSSESSESSSEKLSMEEIGSIQPGTGKRAQESGAFLVIASREDVKENRVETIAKECKMSEVMNLASRCVLLTACGPKTLEVLKPTGLAMVLEAGKEYENAHAVFGFENRPVVCCKTNEFVGKCGEESAVNFVVDEGVAGQVWAAIIKAGAFPVGTEALDAILQ